MLIAMRTTRLGHCVILLTENPQWGQQPTEGQRCSSSEFSAANTPLLGGIDTLRSDALRWNWKGTPPQKQNAAQEQTGMTGISAG